jgi:hypothetical protein
VVRIAVLAINNPDNSAAKVDNPHHAASSLAAKAASTALNAVVVVVAVAVAIVAKVAVVVAAKTIAVHVRKVSRAAARFERIVN